MLLELVLADLGVLDTNHHEVDHGLDLLESAVMDQGVHCVGVESQIPEVLNIESPWEEFFCLLPVKFQPCFPARGRLQSQLGLLQDGARRWSHRLPLQTVDVCLQYESLHPDSSVCDKIDSAVRTLGLEELPLGLNPRCLCDGDGDELSGVFEGIEREGP
jgi:hypothetical protein